MAVAAAGGAFDDLDDQNAWIILNLELQDVEELINTAELQKDKDSGWLQALQVHRLELRRGLSIIRDRRMSHMLVQAARNDNAAIDRFLDQERQDINDRVVAYQLAGMPIPPTLQQAQHEARAEAQSRTTADRNSRTSTASTITAHLAIAKQSQVSSLAQTRATPATASIGKPGSAPNLPSDTAEETARREAFRVRLAAKRARDAESAPILAAARKETSVHDNCGLARASTTSTGFRACTAGTAELEHATDIGVDVQNTSRKRSRESDDDLTSPTVKRLKRGEMATRPAEIAKTLDDLQAWIPQVQQTETALAGVEKLTGPSGKRSRNEDSDIAEPAAKRIDTGIDKDATLTVRQPEDISEAIVAKPVTCVCCGESPDPTDGVRFCVVGCEHTYCGDCLQTLMKNAFVDEQSWPPRCCKTPFVLDNIRPFLSPEILSDYQSKKEEFESEDKTYCSNPECSSFLYAINVLEGEGCCPRCFSVTCMTCKGTEHIGNCPKDTGIQQVLDLAAVEGWKQCGKCKRVVELAHGCNHITCKCKAEWCYVCGVTWRQCNCPQWDENRLLDRAHEVAAQAPAAPNPLQFAAIVEHMRVNHGCEANGRQHAWERFEGDSDEEELECEDCHDELPYFIWRCERCYDRVCTRCRYNR